MRDKAAGRKNVLNDHWSDNWCDEAADYIDKLRTGKETYVCQLDGEIILVGTQEECQAHKDAQGEFNFCWKVQTLQEFGNSQYEAGYDAAEPQTEDM